MEYTRVILDIKPEAFVPVIVAELGEIGFDGFEEKESILEAYIEKGTFDKPLLDEILMRYKELAQIDLKSIEGLENKNWNEIWESNFEPIFVEDKVVVRAPFHDKFSEYQHNILIEPKMSFGTGHHETTWMMMKEMLEIDFKGKTVLDFGCGTGILAVLAFQKEASKIEAIDHEDWAFQNALENIERNGVVNANVMQGSMELVKGMKFDHILANVNRNVLIKYMKDLSDCLEDSGEILFSGILEDDKETLAKAAESEGLYRINELSKGKWILLHCRKNK